MATLEAAGSTFAAAVVLPAEAHAPGLARLLALFDAWVAFSCRGGGCFVASVAAEFDGRAGAVRDHVARMIRAWLATLSRELHVAVQQRKLRAVDPDELAAELYGLALMSNLRRQLLDEAHAPALAQTTARARLYEIATPSGRRLLRMARKEGP